jgi:hypothetical protein
MSVFSHHIVENFKFIFIFYILGTAEVEKEAKG